MKVRRSFQVGTMSAFAAITALAALLWFAILFGTWQFAERIQIDGDLWIIVEALSTALAASAVLGAAYIAHRELSEVSSSRHMEVADRLFVEMNSDENVEARRWVFCYLSTDPVVPISDLPKEGQVAIKRVLNSLDRVAFLTQSGWIPEQIIMPWMHPMITKSWVKLEPYVMRERVKRNEPYYYVYVEALALRCQAWRSKNLAESDIVWLEDAL